MKTPRVQLARLIADKSKSSDRKTLAKEVACYLLEEGRTQELDSILRDVQAIRANEGFVEVIATSAHELSATICQDIEAEARKLYPNAKKVCITPRLQPDLIGGVRLQIIDHQLDLTTRAKLQKFKMLAVYGKDNK